MTRLIRAFTLCLGFVMTLLVSTAGLAVAQDKKLHVTLTCGRTSYAVVVPGYGQRNVWTPAQDNDSNLTFHITSFGEISGTFTPADGSAPETLSEPPKEFQAKAQTRNKHASVECGLSFRTADASGTFEGSGSLTAWTS